MQLENRVLVRDDPAPRLAGLIQAGPFLFVGGCDGQRDLRIGLETLEARTERKSDERRPRVSVVPIARELLWQS